MPCGGSARTHAMRSFLPDLLSRPLNVTEVLTSGRAASRNLDCELSQMSVAKVCVLRLTFATEFSPDFSVPAILSRNLVFLRQPFSLVVRMRTASRLNSSVNRAASMPFLLSVISNRSHPFRRGSSPRCAPHTGGSGLIKMGPPKLPVCPSLFQVGALGHSL